MISPFPRRELLQRVGLAVLSHLIPRTTSAVTPSIALSRPEFAIGDLIARDWEGDEDEDAPGFATDFGEVVGLCYLPEDSHCYPRHTWVYYIRWTRSTCSTCSFPCFDGEPTAGNTLRLVSHG